MRLPALTALLLTVALTACSPDREEELGAKPRTAVQASPKPAGEKPPAVRKQARKEIRIALTGDFLVHSTVWGAAATPAGFDFHRLIAPAQKPIQSADLAICHLETPLAPRGGPYSSYPLFSTPPTLLQGIKQAGFDGCTTASNHTVDKGFEGLARTVSFLEKAKLGHSGSQARPRAPRFALYDVKGLTVASLSYTYGTNGMPVEYPWSVNMLNAKTILADARPARRAGADVVLAGLHWGLEYQTEPTGDQVALAETLAASDTIDFLYGHHAHVVQPIRRVRGNGWPTGWATFLPARPVTCRASTMESSRRSR